MKNILKIVYNLLTTLFQTLISIISILLFSSFRLNNLLDNSKENKKCLVLGNGPSLKEEMKSNFNYFIENRENVICVNLFFEDKIFLELCPSYYIIVDDGMWSKTSNKRILNIQSSFITNMNDVYWEMKLLLPYEAKSFIKKKLRNDNIDCIYFNRTPVTGFTAFRHIIYNRNLGMPAPHNVLNAALMVGISLGYKEIDIYGADHSWISDLFVSEGNTLCCYQNHFYDERTEIIELEKGSLYKGLMGIVLAFQSYELINEYAIYKDVKIVNKTKKSFLDIFNFE